MKRSKLILVTCLLALFILPLNIAMADTNVNNNENCLENNANNSSVNSADAGANASSGGNKVSISNPQNLRFVGHMQGDPRENFLYKQTGRTPVGVHKYEDDKKIVNKADRRVWWFKSGAGIDGSEGFREEAEETKEIRFVVDNGRINYAGFDEKYIVVGAINRKVKNKKLTQEDLDAYARLQGMDNGATVIIAKRGWVYMLNSETSGLTIGASTGKDLTGGVMMGWANGKLMRVEDPAIVATYYRLRTEEEKAAFLAQRTKDNAFASSYFLKETPAEKKVKAINEQAQTTQMAVLKAEQAKAELEAFKAQQELKKAMTEAKAIAGNETTPVSPSAKTTAEPTELKKAG